MVCLLVAAALAAAVPADYIDSVAVAAYWYKKDARGRGDDISEREKPRRYPAFALAADTFILSDPSVRTGQLDRVELWFGGRRYPAREVSRTEFPDTVTIRTEAAVTGLKPLVFKEGEAAEKLVWSWENDVLGITVSTEGTNRDVRVSSESGRAFHQGRGNALVVDASGAPVGIDFGDRLEVKGGRFVHLDPTKLRGVPADGFERAAQTVERRLAAAVLPVVVHMEQEDKDARNGRRFGWREDEGAKTEFDALGYVIGGRVLVPSSLTGEAIARLARVEAALADGTRTNLVFAGAFAEWNGMLFDLPGDLARTTPSMDIVTGEGEAFDGRRAWSVQFENESGRVIATARRMAFRGVEFLRGAVFAPGLRTDSSHRSYNDERAIAVHAFDADGRIAAFTLDRRFGGSRYYRESEKVSGAELEKMIAGGEFNPEFAPRNEEDRNRFVWFGVETVPLTDALAREKRAQSFLGEYSRPPLVTEVYPDSPAERAGVRVGDILLFYRRGKEAERKLTAENDYSGRDWSRYFEMDELYSVLGVTATPWPNVENEMNRQFSKFGDGARVSVGYVRDGARAETEVVLAAAPVHYRNAGKSRNRTLGILVKDMTFEVRRYFKFADTDPGVIIAKIKPGSPAAVAGLKVYELVTEVNGEKVSDAKDFAARIKDKSDLVFSVRRLSQTRMVKIRLK